MTHNLKFSFYNLLTISYLAIMACWLMLACSGSSEALLQKSKKYLADGQPEQAINLLNKLIENDANNAEAFNMRAVAFFEQKEFASAGLDYQQAIKLKPNWYKPYFNRALMRQAMQDPEGALADYKQALNCDSTIAEVYLNRGSVLGEGQKYTAAMADFEKAVQLDAGNKNAWYNLGNMQYQLDFFDKAQQSFTKAVKLDNNFGKAYYAMGMLYINTSNNELACVNLKQAKKLGYEPAFTAVSIYCQ
jgi:tetratricopeptide (TPR) repeat protein